MNTYGRVTQAIAGLDERGMTSLGVRARALREAGLILTTGRGRSAKLLTLREAALMVIGLNCGVTAQEGVEVTPHFCALENKSKALRVGAWMPPAIRALHDADTLLDAVETLFAVLDAAGGPEFQIKLCQVTRHAEIFVTWKPPLAEHREATGFVFSSDFRVDHCVDRRVDVLLTHRTLRAVKALYPITCQ